MKKIGSVLLLLLFLIVSATSYALPFNIGTKSGTQLPTTVKQFSTATAYYTVTNNTGSLRNNNYVKYLPPNVTQVTSGGTFGGTCGTTFNLAAGANCVLQLTVSGAVNANDPDPHHHLFVCFQGGITCAGTLNSLNVSAATLTSIAIIPINPTLPAGLKQQFTAIGAYSDGSSQDITSQVTWHSSNTGAATIATGGNATTVAAGTTNITATLGSATSNTATLTVTSTSLASIAVTPTNPSLAAGLTQQFTATGTYSDGTTLDITSSVTWNSATPSVATIASGGLATTISTGTTNITASLNGVTSPAQTLTVTSATLVSIAIIPPNASLAAGLTQQYTAVGTYSDSSTLDITASVTWQSSNTAAATIASGGLATTVAAGTTNITATLSGKTSNTATLTVTTATLVSIAVTPSNPSIAAGLTQQFTATGTYSDGTTLNITSSVTWNSATPSIATIVSGGLATGIAAGTTNITATLGSVTSPTNTLTVTAATLTSISITPKTASIAAGLTQQYTAIGTYSDNSMLDITSSVIWHSSNTSAATIVSGGSTPGLATTIAAGTTNITATLSGKTSNTAVLTVTTATLVSIAVTPTSPTLAVGLTQQFTATGTYTDSSTVDLTSLATWHSSAPSIATIVSGGLATAVAAGTTDITANYQGVTSPADTLTVIAATLQTIAITPSSANLAAGLHQQFTATGTYSDSSTLNITASVIWQSSNTSAVTIISSGSTSGLATAVAAGSASIKATLSGVTSNTAPFTVTSPPVTLPAGASSCAVLSNTTITSAGVSAVTGNMCLSPPGVSITGFPPGTITNGSQHIDDATAVTAQTDTTTLYNSLKVLSCTVNEPAIAELGGQTLTPGVYCFPTSAAITTGPLTLSGAGNYVFIIGTTLVTSGGGNVVLINGALSTNIYWDVGTAATLGTSTNFIGRLISTTATTIALSATVNGSVTSTGAGVTLSANTITQQAY